MVILTELSSWLNHSSLEFRYIIFWFLWIILTFFFSDSVCVLVAQLCLTLCDPMDCSPPGSSVTGIILQARILEWVAIPFSRGSSQPRDQTRVFCIMGRFFTTWATSSLVKQTLKSSQGTLTKTSNLRICIWCFKSPIFLLSWWYRPGYLGSRLWDGVQPFKY